MAALKGFKAGSVARIVLLDHNPEFRRVTAKMMESRTDMRLVDSLKNGDGALADILQADPHLILMSIDGPDGAALRSLPLIRQAMPGVGIIALALSADRAYKKAALEAGADDLVIKANLVTDLLPAILRLAPVD
jgi:DNA-binding NarL/FixJ family response regulator